MNLGAVRLPDMSKTMQGRPVAEIEMYGTAAEVFAAHAERRLTRYLAEDWREVGDATLARLQAEYEREARAAGWTV